MKDKEFLNWTEQRKKGIWKFTLFNGVFSWGLPMLVAMAFINKPFEHGFTLKAAAIHSMVWIFAGVLFGLLLWIVNEWRYKKQVVKNAT